MAATLTAQLRTERGKNAARRLRRNGEVPAVVYGHGDQTQVLTLQEHELERLLMSISVENTIIDLKVGDDPPVPALIREVQYHPVKPLVQHVDLYQIHAGESIHLDIPIHLHGNPVGVRESSGVLQEVLRDLSVECLPRDIPEAVHIDISELKIGDTVHVSDVSLPNVQILNDPDLVICTVTTPTVAALEEGPETETGAGGEVEPELVRSRREAEEVPFEHGSAQPE